MDTPRTDAAINTIQYPEDGFATMRNLSRQIERELAEARKVLKTVQTVLKRDQAYHVVINYPDKPEISLGQIVDTALKS